MILLIMTIVRSLIAVLVLYAAQHGYFRHDRVFLFLPKTHVAWQSAEADWRGSSEMAVEHHTSGGSLEANAVAQSFVPHSPVIQAVQMRFSLGMVPRGWLRVELTNERDGMPGRVLARSWLRFDENTRVLSGDYLAVPITAVLFEPDATYWITIVECRDRGFKQYSLASTIGSLADTYPEGRAVIASGSPSTTIADIDFRIFATAPIEPVVEEVSELMQNALPPGECRTADWRKAHEICNRALPPAAAPAKRQ